ncbi:Nn.00g018010.m01.CDS01 [Neocucurbitaria sp. VM-36]
MASNNYSPYSYPYQQSSAQQYPTYQTASSSNNAAHSSRQHQQPSTGQAQDYMAYQPQSYTNQDSGYSRGQDNSWGSGNYGGTRETTSRAAEVLHNMSNTTYTPNSTLATNQSDFTVTNSANSASPQMQAQTHATHTSYGQSQARPRSTNSNRIQTTTSRGLPPPATAAGYPSQRAQALYNQQQHRSASPAQHQYSATPVTSARESATKITATAQYNDYSQRQLPGVEASRTSQNASTSNSYDYASSQMPPTPNVPPASTATVADTYNGQSATTVDPMAVYDPWPEYQRKQEALGAQKAEEERIAERSRKLEEQKEEEERKRREEEDKLRQPKPTTKKVQRQHSTVTEAASVAPEPSAGSAEGLENEIRAMMAKMRELNGKDPALLARIWEEERRAKLPKPPAVPNTSASQAVVPQPAQAVQASAANSKKKTTPREPVKANVAKLAAPVLARAESARSQAHVASNRSVGSTIWPPEKIEHLANAAATYLNGRNPHHRTEPSRILSMLKDNPSYIELCEQLEQMGVTLDRAAFAKNLLIAVPDVNSASRKSAPQPTPVAVQRAQVPAAVLKKEIAASVAGSPQHIPAAASYAYRGSYPAFPDKSSFAATPVAVAEMVPIKAELKAPANKEEAARKRNLSELVDLTLLSEEEEMGLPTKRQNTNSTPSFGTPHPHAQDPINLDKEPTINNFPIAHMPSHPPRAPIPPTAQASMNELRHRQYVDQLDKKKALRRNSYNPSTIARDVLLACGRHPSERQLNQHLDVLRTTLTQISFDSDLSTIRWDLIDPGNPPPGYFKDGVQGLTEDADDEEDSDDEEARLRAPSSAIGGEGGAQARVQALPEPSNPFKQKRRGRPPRHSFPNSTSPSTPKRPTSSVGMSVSAPRPSSPAAGVGYSAFRSATEYGPDGQPLPKKRGRPVGWRKAIHGSVTAQARASPNGHTGSFIEHQPLQPSSLRNVKPNRDEPIQIDSRSPSVAAHVAQYQSYQCKWQDCKADLHNLETLKKHVFKVHRKITDRNTLQCLWDDCGKEVANHGPMTNVMIERHTPYSFDLESNWRNHIEQSHIRPLSWELGDGPASGLSEQADANESEAYLSDAQGRQVTPRITVDLERFQADNSTSQGTTHVSRGRGRPPKVAPEQETRDAQARLISHKKRTGGPGMDRGGARLVNDKRRKGFNDNSGTEEELVDAEDLVGRA